MSAPPSDARTMRAELVRSAPCGDDAVIVAVRAAREFAPVRAGRFFMLKRTDGASPLIPRPFSIYRQKGAELEFLVKVVGRGTAALAAASPGGELLLTGPLGNGWPAMGGEGLPWVFLAGGVGSASFPLAIEQALAGMDGAPPVAPDRLCLLLGAARAGSLYDLPALEATGIAVHTATDDGSAGLRGTVLDLLASRRASGEIPPAFRILACGPEPMLRAVAGYAERQGLACWLSLETRMGCGVGICNGCPVPTRPGGPRGGWPHVPCCTEGPVFEAGEIALG
ncbi:MAG: dihydroorotate dehydrogenase electron transfer subunit [Planctomycetota bacterium]